jgi:hypothetical protein
MGNNGETMENGKQGKYPEQTKTMQIKITNPKDGSVFFLAPTIYQSCMNPDDIRIDPLWITEKSGWELLVKNRYQSEQIDLRKMQVELLPWEAKIRKTDCLHCENCGRCGW